MDRDRLITIFVMTINMVIIYLFNIFIASHMQTAQYGAFSFWLTVIKILAVMSCLGFNRIFYRFIPIYYREKQFHESSGLFRNAIGYTIVFSIIIAFILLFIFSEVSVGTMTSEIFIHTIWVLPIFAVLHLFRDLIKSYGFVITASISSGGAHFLWTLLISMVLLLYIGYLNGMYLALSFGISLTFTIMIQVYFLLKNIDRQYFTSSKINHIKMWFSNSIPMLMTSLIFYGTPSVSVILTWLFLGEHDTGLYNAALSISLLVSIPRAATISLSSSKLFFLFMEDDKSLLADFTRDAGKMTGLYTLLIVILFIVFGKYLLALFGSQYVVAYSALCVLLIDRLWMGGNHISTQLLNLTGQQKFCAVVNFIGLLLMVVFSLLLAPIFHIVGMAMALLASQVVTRLWISIRIKRRLSINVFSYLIPKRGINA